MSIAYKKNGVWVTASGTPPIDDALSATSENAVQNKVVKQAVDGKSDTSHTHDDRYYTKGQVDGMIPEVPTMTPLTSTEIYAICT